jgi:DNA-binding NtrC family response regulator
MARLMVVDHDKKALEDLCRLLKKDGHEVVGVGGGTEALQMLPYVRPDLVVTDLEMMPVDGMKVLQAAKECDPHTAVIVTSAYATVRGAVSAMKCGAADYVSKPYYFNILKRSIDEAIQSRARPDQLAGV